MSSRALFAALDVGLFTALRDGAVALSELADDFRLVPEALETLLTVLVAEGLVVQEAGRYANSPAADRFLVTGAREDYSDYLRLQIGQQVYQQLPMALGGLRGDQRAMASEGMQGWLADPAEAQLFSRSQHAGSMGPARQLSKRLDLSDCRSMLDVAGGSGAFSITLCSLNSELRSTILDFSTVVDVARGYVADAGLTDRIDFVPGNALDTEWPADQDLVLMSYLLSAVPGRHHMQLMEQAWAATGPGGRLVVHDFMLDNDRSGPLATAQFFLVYLPTTAGAVSFTGADVAGLVESIGFTADVEAFIPGLTKLVVATKPGASDSEQRARPVTPRQND